MVDIQTLIHSFCEENHLPVDISQEMPAGYETAFGTYDVAQRTLFINVPVLTHAPDYAALFYVYHELRHAVQYHCPHRFPVEVRESLPYVILFNGTCFRLVGHEWRECVLDGDSGWFTDAYLSLPYERDANDYAYRMVQSTLGHSPELTELYASWLPQRQWPYEEEKKLFRLIDEKTGG